MHVVVLTACIFLLTLFVIIHIISIRSKEAKGVFVVKRILCVLLVCICFVSIFAVSAVPVSAASYPYTTPRFYLSCPTDNGIHMYFDLKPGVTRYRMYYRDLNNEWQRAGSDYVVSASTSHTGKWVDRSIRIPNLYHGRTICCTLRYLNANGTKFLSDYKAFIYAWRKAPDVGGYSLSWNRNRDITKLSLTLSDNNYADDALGYTIFARNSSTGFIAIARHCHGRTYTFSSSELKTINNLLKNHGHVVFTVRECMDTSTSYCSTYWDSAVTFYKASSGRYAATDWNTNL